MMALFAVGAATTFTMVGARNSKCKALAVTLETARALACATFSVLLFFAAKGISNFRSEGLWISFQNLVLSALN